MALTLSTAAATTIQTNARFGLKAKHPKPNQTKPLAEDTTNKYALRGIFVFPPLHPISFSFYFLLNNSKTLIKIYGKVWVRALRVYTYPTPLSDN